MTSCAHIDDVTEAVRAPHVKLTSLLTSSRVNYVTSGYLNRRENAEIIASSNV